MRKLKQGVETTQPQSRQAQQSSLPKNEKSPETASSESRAELMKSYRPRNAQDEQDEEIARFLEAQP